jgi:predicted ATPase/DNA-binding winged helix-turn-helix (wHTH) protein
VIFRFGGWSLDDRRLSVVGPEGAVHVEPQVFEVLRVLIAERDRVVPKEHLLDTVWGDRFVSESALTSRIKAARRAVGDDGQAQRVIKTVHGRGYQFVAAVTVEDGRTVTATTAGAGSIGTSTGGRALPRLRNALIGRADDVSSVVARIGGAPLVTIVGPGGMGKTTVALAVAERLQAHYADGVVFADLSPVPPLADVTRAVADAAGVEGAASESVEKVAEHLAHRPLLLVLDNCEHVLAQSAELVDRMLQRGGPADVLATSRELLGVAGEHVWPLGPLHDGGPVLFVERARAAEPRVAWDPADPAVVELCQRLDHVPLALELAAGQLRRFDLDELRRRLDDRLDLLAGRSGRHATMETAIDWSYRLLEPAEQALLQQLSVFPSSFGVAAVEATAATNDAMAVFGQLVDKSLVVRQPGAGRYRLLETIKLFGRDRLDEAGSTDGAFERHRRHVRRRVASSARLDRWMSARLGAELRADFDDARQAFRRSLDSGDAGDALEIAVGASFLWRQALGCSEGQGWVDDLLAAELAPGDLAWAHILRSDLGQGRGDHIAMFGGGAEALDVLKAAELDDPAGAGVAAHFAALIHLTDGDRALAPLRSALDLAHASRDRRLVTLVEDYCCMVDVIAGRHDQARDALGRLDRAASDDGYDRFILSWTGWMEGLATHDSAIARRWISAQHEFLDRTGIVETWLTSFSTALCEAAEGKDIAPELARALDLADREGYDAGPDCLLAVAYAELLAGRSASAAELVATAMHSRFNNTAHYVLYRAVLDRPLQAELDAGRWAAATERGRGRTTAEALAAHGITG